ncbi:hypothetical protein FOZ60_015425, partial [Perkinsus olseni]
MARKPDDTPSSEKAAADKAAADKAAADKAAADEAAADKAAADKAAADKAAAEKGTPKRLRKANASKASTSDQTEDNKKKTSPPSSSSEAPVADDDEREEDDGVEDGETDADHTPKKSKSAKTSKLLAEIAKASKNPSNSIGSGEAAMSRAANHFVTKLIEGLNNKSPADGSDGRPLRKDTLKAAADAIRKSGIGSFDPKLFNMDALAAAIKDNNYILTEPPRFSGTSNKFGGLPLCKAYDTHVRQGTRQDGIYQRDLHPGCSQPPVSSRNDKWKSSDSRGHKRSRNDSWNSYYNSHSSNYYWNKNWGSSSWGDDKKDDDKKKKDEKSPGTSNGGGHHEPPPVDTSPTIPAAHSPESPDSAEAVRAPRVVHPEPLADTSVIALADLHREAPGLPDTVRAAIAAQGKTGTRSACKGAFGGHEVLGKPAGSSWSRLQRTPVRSMPEETESGKLNKRSVMDLGELLDAGPDLAKKMARKLEGNPSEWDETLWKSAIEETEAKTMIGPIPGPPTSDGGSLTMQLHIGRFRATVSRTRLLVLRLLSSYFGIRLLVKASAFFHVAQPFGASSSVINYCRVSQALAHLGRILLALILINFLDDYFAPERASSVDSGYEAWRWLHVIPLGPRHIDFWRQSTPYHYPREKKAKIIDKIQGGSPKIDSHLRRLRSWPADSYSHLRFYHPIACRPYLREACIYSDATSAGGIGAVASAKDFVRPIYAA